jgi:hypothetical protein
MKNFILSAALLMAVLGFACTGTIDEGEADGDGDAGTAGDGDAGNPGDDGSVAGDDGVSDAGSDPGADDAGTGDPAKRSLARTCWWKRLATPR